jgi:hypothetical protein
VIFSDFRIDDKNEHTLELMIDDLLKMGNSEKSTSQPPDKIENN